MRKCDMGTGAARIRNALKNLETAWNERRDEWNDAVSQRFAAHHLEPMIPQVKLALDAISRMHLLLDEVQRDCES